jgi:DNA-binding LacI/PurR family transcriptional regulator
VGTRLLPTSPIACVDAPLAEIARTAANAMLGWMQGEAPQSQLIAPTGFLPRETISEVKNTSPLNK